MGVLTTEKKIITGNVVLDAELPLLNENELAKLGNYAKYLRWLRDEEDNSWADVPLTPDEEAQREESIRDFQNGEYLTLDEFMEGL